MPPSREETIQRLKALLPELQARYGMHGVALFGSMARGDYDEQSDVDILSDFSKPIGWDIVDICDLLERSLGRKVDVIHAHVLQRGRVGDRIRNELFYL